MDTGVRVMNKVEILKSRLKKDVKSANIVLFLFSPFDFLIGFKDTRLSKPAYTSEYYFFMCHVRT